MNIKKQYIQINGIKLAYEDRGNGPPIVFIHGFPTSCKSWRSVADKLVDRYRCISFDLMGFGDSDKPLNESYTIPRHSELLMDAINKLGLTKPMLVGHSMGGGMCLYIAHKMKENVSGVFVSDPACYLQQLPWFFLALKVPVIPILVLRLIPPKIAYWMVKDTAFDRKSCKHYEDMYEYIINVQKAGAAEAFVSTARDINKGEITSLISNYSNLNIPIGIIWGKKDRIIPVKFAHRLASDIPDASLTIVENCGHCPQEEYPEITYNALKDILVKIKNTDFVKACI